MKILVTAANGHTGYPTAIELLNLGFEVIAFVRNEYSIKAKELKKRGAEIFIGDMNDYKDYKAALINVKRAYFCAPLGRNSLFKTTAFIAAAEDAKLEHVVYMSQWLLMQDHHAINTRENWLGDQMVKLHRDVKYTFVIPGIFAFAYFLTLPMIAQLGIMPIYAKGEGLNSPPSEEDQGRVIANILKDPANHHGKSYRPTGPKIISQQEIATIFSKILNRKVTLKEVSKSMLLKSLKAMKFNAYDYSNIHYYMKDLENNTFAIGGTTNVVKELTGSEPEDFETIAKRYIENTPEARQTFANKIKVILLFIKITLTKTPDMLAYEIDKQYPRLFKGMYLAKESTTWFDLRSNTSNEVEK